MLPSSCLLLLTAAATGCFHTLLGPDHYLPFAALAASEKWTTRKTIRITALGGLAHLASAALLGWLGILLGTTASGFLKFESWRGGVAAWGLIAFGLVYIVWGVKRAWRKRSLAQPQSVTPAGAGSYWALFLLLVLGPCEPLIPLFMAARVPSQSWLLPGVTFIFGGVTILTMLGMVLMLSGARVRLPLPGLGRYRHALAGAAIVFCGLAVRIFGI